MPPYSHTIAPLRAIADSARQFGLTEDEIWQTVNEAMCQAGTESTVSECLDDVAGALARRILHKERLKRSIRLV